MHINIQGLTRTLRILRFIPLTKACPSGTYGENCAEACACGVGSSRCDVTTGCVCQSGWAGERCDADVNECQTVQAQEECRAQSAQCANSQGGYSCRCAPGFAKPEGGDVCQGKRSVGLTQFRSVQFSSGPVCTKQFIRCLGSVYTRLGSVYTRLGSVYTAFR